MRLILCALIVMLSSLARAEADRKTLVIIGDSLTEGYGVSRDEAYPARVERKIEASGRHWKVINSGVSGSTAASAPARVAWALKSKPDLLVLALGANDGLRGSPLADVERNLARALTLCREAKVKVLLVGIRVPPNYGAKFAGEVKAMFERLAREFKVALMPYMLDHVAGVAALNQSDGLHPNANGHAVLADSVYAALDKLL